MPNIFVGVIIVVVIVIALHNARGDDMVIEVTMIQCRWSHALYLKHREEGGMGIWRRGNDRYMDW